METVSKTAISNPILMAKIRVRSNCIVPAHFRYCPCLTSTVQLWTQGSRVMVARRPSREDFSCR